MVKIPPNVSRIIVHPSSHKILSTVSPSGEPHSIICSSLFMKDDETIAVAEVWMHRTCENLANDPRAEFLIWLGKDGYSLKAEASERVTSGEMFDAVSKKMDRYSLDTVAVWTFRVTEIWDESASWTAGEKVA